MNQDPYKVLGLTPDATDDEVKAAYKKLAKKYHPDLNGGSAEAEARMKEINSAYATIMKKQTAGPGSSYGGGYGGYGGYGSYGGYGGSGYGSAGYGSSSYGEQESPQMRAAANYINTGYYQEALNVLEGIAEHTARWYYYSAVANAGLGNSILAMNHAQQAVNMDPDNFEYRQLLSQLSHGGRAYRARGGAYGVPSMNIGNICLGLCLARMFCPFCWC